MACRTGAWGGRHKEAWRASAAPAAWKGAGWGPGGRLGEQSGSRAGAALKASCFPLPRAAPVLMVLLAEMAQLESR